MDLTAWSARLRTFASERGWEQFHTRRNLAEAISVEASELLELYQWHTKRFIDVAIDPSAEVADVMIYLLRFCDVAGIDLEAAVEAKIAANAAKYPVAECAKESARGEFRKR